MTDEPREKPEAQPERQEPDVPPVEIDPLLGDHIQEGARPPKETKHE
jgi:hypothetical protein